jgi:hypothetical protein
VLQSPLMEPFARRRFELAPEDRFSLRTTVERDRPAFAARLDGTLEIDALEQPFFDTIEILEVVSPAPFPPQRLYVAWARSPRRLWVLSGRIDRLCEVAAAERPQGLTDPRTATAYALAGDGWTSEAPLGALRIDALAEIPWFPELDAKERAVVDELERTLGDRVRPLQTTMSAGEYQLTLWLVSSQRLIERVLRVTLDGALVRDDRIHAEKLPLPAGRTWGLVRGRYVPTG